MPITWDGTLDELVDELTGFRAGDPPVATAPQPTTTFVPDLRDEGLDWPRTALTMIGRKRLRNYGELIERALAEGIEGDVVEAGVWRGGASIYARAVLATHGVTDRKVVVADSFEGLPPPDEDRYPLDAGSRLHDFDELGVGEEAVRAAFARHGLLDEQVVFVRGWFRDTMPTLPVTSIAVLRLDGDMYESTWDVLVHAYDKVTPGGFVIVDDYIHAPCRAAVEAFLGPRGLDPEIVPIDRVGAWFQKPAA